MTGPPSDSELRTALRPHIGDREAVTISRRPYRYATSAPLEEVQVTTGDGAQLRLILKDLDRERLLGDAHASKPGFLYDPRRETGVYRAILAPNGIGPACYAATAEPKPARNWLLLEKVPGVELWQIGELGVWERVAAWLAAFHGRFAGRARELREASPQLLEFSASWFRSWCERADAALASSGDPRAPRLREALRGYQTVIGDLAGLPTTFVHGELYPSNVLVERDRQPPRICPIDWEMAGVGTGLIDLAALVGGWDADERRRLIAAYRDALPQAEAVIGDRRTLPMDLARCRLHLALQWLGWSNDWRPPPEHAHDWVGEALGLSEKLGLADGGER
jgi:Phosphotransferase enzyme family